MPSRIAIVVHGRFHAFDLARELIKLGKEVVLLTNYPKRVAGKFGIPGDKIINCVPHGVASRLAQRLGLGRVFEPQLHCWYSRWAARALASIKTDVVHSFSGVSEDLFRAYAPGRPLKSLVRGSSHIRTQARLLGDEEVRCGRQIERPSEWMIQRETREYELADLILVLSSFARQSFLEQGFPAEKLRVLSLGSEVQRFRPDPEVVERRCARILSKAPLNVLTVGSFSFQKGAHDLAKIAEREASRFKFRFVGDIPGETRQLRKQIRGKVRFLPRQPQFSLPQQYAEADLFLFPTIQDGYAVVLAQALASGLPVLATANCAAPDIVLENKTGWVLPIRSPVAFVEKLRWCDGHRSELAAMARATFEQFRPRDWSQVASDFVRIYQDWFQAHAQ